MRRWRHLKRRPTRAGRCLREGHRAVVVAVVGDAVALAYCHDYDGDGVVLLI